MMSNLRVLIFVALAVVIVQIAVSDAEPVSKKGSVAPPQCKVSPSGPAPTGKLGSVGASGKAGTRGGRLAARPTARNGRKVARKN